MKASAQDRLRNTGVAFTLVGIVALCLSLTVLMPDHGTNAPAIGAATFVVVGLLELAIWAVRRR